MLKYINKLICAIRGRHGDSRFAYRTGTTKVCRQCRTKYEVML